MYSNQTRDATLAELISTARGFEIGYVALQLKDRPLNGLALTTPSDEGPSNKHVDQISSKTLDDLVSESIDEVLTELIGTKPKEAVYDYLERNYSLARDNIPKNLPKFIELLESTFGRGSRTICKGIARRMFEKLGWEFTEVRGFELLDYLEAARARVARELIEHAKAANHNHTSL
jgi:hypothetical protein